MGLSPMSQYIVKGLRVKGDFYGEITIIVSINHSVSFDILGKLYYRRHQLTR